MDRCSESEMEIKRELFQDERLLWSGCPHRGIVLRLADVLLIPFSLVWGGFAIAWEIDVIVGRGPLIMQLFGLPFVVIGCYLILGRFFVDAYIRSRTHYGVTNERILIVSGFLHQSVNSISIAMLTDFSLVEKRDGTGSISIGPRHPLYGLLTDSSWPGMGKQRVPRLTSSMKLDEFTR